MMWSKTAAAMFGAIALLCGSAQPALAQATGQTPENAQKFLKTVLDQGSVSTNLNVAAKRYMDQGWNCGGSSVCSTTAYRYGKVAWSGSPEVCSTSLVVYITNTGGRDGHADVVVTEGSPAVTMRWGTISAAKSSGSDVSFSWSGRISTLTFATPELAQRIEKAVTVLINHCDPTKGTGF